MAASQTVLAMTAAIIKHQNEQKASIRMGQTLDIRHTNCWCKLLNDLLVHDVASYRNFLGNVHRVIRCRHLPKHNAAHCCLESI